MYGILNHPVIVKITFDPDMLGIGAVTMLFVFILLAPGNVATYCGISPLHTPSRFMNCVVPGPLGLKTWHEPGGAFGAKLFALKTPS